MQVLKSEPSGATNDDATISSLAAQPEPNLREQSELYVEFEHNLLRLDVCLSHDTVSVLFGKVFEKIQLAANSFATMIEHMNIGRSRCKHTAARKNSVSTAVVVVAAMSH